MPRARNPRSDETRKTELRFLLATLLVVGVLAFLTVRAFLMYVVFGALLTFAFWPVHRRLRRRVRPKGLAAFVSLLLVTLVLVGPLFLVSFMVFEDAVDFTRTYNPGRLNETVQAFLDRVGIRAEPGAEDNETAVRTTELANTIGEKIRGFAQKLGNEFFLLLPGLALGLFVTAFIVYYGFADGELFYHQLRHALPLPDDVEDALFRNLANVTRAVFLGTILVALLSAVLATATFLLFGVPNAVFFGFLMVILGILPIVGAPFVWVPVTVWLFLQGDKVGALTILAINAVVGFGYIEHVLRPRLIGRLGQIHPVWVLLGVLGGIEFFGILGFVVGPLIIGIFVGLLRSYTEFHPRWSLRRGRKKEPHIPQGELRPQPFKRPPRSRAAARRRPTKA